MSASMAAEAGKGKYRGDRVRQMDKGVGLSQELVALVDPTAPPTPTPSSADEMFTKATCYYCNERGHIVRYGPKKGKDGC